MTKELRTVVVQMTSVDSYSKNFESILNYLAEIKKQGDIDLICFPENCLYMPIGKTMRLDSALEPQSKYFTQLADVAQKMNCSIILGGVAMTFDGVACKNTLVYVSQEGEITFPYDKIHLFDVDLPSGLSMKESDTFTSGDHFSIINIGEWKVGLSICYDLRFSVLFNYFSQEQVDLIIVPAAFMVETGRVHWRTLLRARSIETQAYVVAPAQIGEHQSIDSNNTESRNSWGEALIIDPCGHILKQARNFDQSGKKEILYSALSKDKINDFRLSVPMHKNKKIKSKFYF